MAVTNTERSAWAARSHELAQLMSRCALGDRAAFARLYDLTSPHLFAVVLRIQRDRALAEDLLQEVYVNLWRSAGSFDAAQSQPMTWLTSVARNKAIDSLRRAQSQPVLQSVHRDDDDDDREFDRAGRRRLADGESFREVVYPEPGGNHHGQVVAESRARR